MPQCDQGCPAYCSTWLPLNLLGGTRSDGSGTLSTGEGPVTGHFFGQSSYSELALVDERSLVKVPQAASLTLLAPLGCGVQTGAGAVLNVLQAGRPARPWRCSGPERSASPR